MVLKITTQQTETLDAFLSNLVGRLESFADTVEEEYVDNDEYDADEEVVQLAGTVMRYSRLLSTAFKAFYSVLAQIEANELDEIAEEIDGIDPEAIKEVAEMLRQRFSVQQEDDTQEEVYDDASIAE